MSNFMSRGAGSAFGGKKLLLVLSLVVLLAAACNSQQPAQQTNNQPAANPQQQQVQNPPANQPTQQQAGQAVSWKIYTDVKNGFEIKYPAKQWLLKTADNVISISLDRPNSESPVVQVTVSGQTVAAMADQILADIKSDPVQKLVSDKTGSFAGVISREIIYSPAAGGLADFILMSKWGKTFQLLKLNNGEENKELDAILSSFEFTSGMTQGQTDR